MSYKLVECSGGKFAKVDEGDYNLVIGLNWTSHYNPTSQTFYAENSAYLGQVNGKTITKCISMHRLLMNPEKGMFVDHKNGDGLDNRRENLRVCTRAQNNSNRDKHMIGTSKYKGVWKGKNKTKYRCCIRVNKQRIHLGYFENELDAAKKYNEAALLHHGEFANLNKI